MVHFTAVTCNRISWSGLQKKRVRVRTYRMLLVNGPAYYSVVVFLLPKGFLNEHKLVLGKAQNDSEFILLFVEAKRIYMNGNVTTAKD